MKIYGIRGREVLACAGSWAYVAEAEVEEDNGSETYVTAQIYAEGLELTVSKQSVYGFTVVGVGDPVEKFMEEYTTWGGAKESAYADVFKKLKSVINMLGRK